MRRIHLRPTILLAVVSLGAMGILALMWDQKEVATGAMTGIVALASKIMDSEEAMTRELTGQEQQGTPKNA